MVIVNINNGLGNQLFEYACGYAVAKHDGDTLKLDTSDCDNSKLREFELNNFKLDGYKRESFSNRTLFQKVYKKIRKKILYHEIFENKSIEVFCDNQIYKPQKIRNKYLHGTWQSYRIFELYKDDIIRQYVASYDQEDKVKQMIKEFNNMNTCAIHIRTGDIKPLSTEYWNKAIEYMESQGSNMQYIIFSNDIKEALTLLPKFNNVRYHCINDWGTFTDLDEFFLMSACQNQIISNSTYSWWAAYLNMNENKIVVAPSLGKRSKKMYPEIWKVVEYA